MAMINLTAPINQLGYGIVGLNVLKQLVKAGKKPSYLPVFHGIKTDPPQEDVALVQRCLDRPFYPEGNSLRIWHQHDLAHHCGTGKRCVFPIFELDQFTDEEKHHLRNQDVLFVCSNWAFDTVCNELGDDCPLVVTTGLGVDRSIFFPAELNPYSYTVFLNIGKWEVRKGHDVLIDAFNRAFEPKDRVRLWMIPSNPFLTKEQTAEWEDMYMKSKMGRAGKVQIFPRQRTQVDIAKKMREADVGVWPARAEGWNLELLEMLACGKNAIATFNTAHMDFIDDSVCRCIDTPNKEEAFDGVFFKGGGGNWAELGEAEIEQLVVHMRELHRQKQERELAPNERGIDIAETFSWENAVQPILEHCCS